MIGTSARRPTAQPAVAPVHAILGKFDLPRRSAIGSQLIGAG